MSISQETRYLIAKLESAILANLSDVATKKKVKSTIKDFVIDLDEPTHPRLTSVVSSTLDSVGYNPIKETLYIKFSTGATYAYQSVPADVYDDLMSAPSLGRHFAEYIKNDYGEVKIA